MSVVVNYNPQHIVVDCFLSDHLSIFTRIVRKCCAL